MKLHDKEEDFRALIALTSEKFGIADVLVEKDYWVTKALKNLASSPLVGKVVFKGGTSLSKAHKLIQRFSEDIDLAVIVEDGMKDAAIKALLKAVEKECSSGFKEKDGDLRTSKGSKFRKTVWEYPRIKLEGQYGDAGEYILFEVNSFTVPEPHEAISINSLITEFLLIKEDQKVIDEFELNSFKMPVLRTERTFIEKISALTKGCYIYEIEPYDVLRKNIRHFYDVTKLNAKCGPTLFSNRKELIDLLSRVKGDDLKMDPDMKWAGKPYKNAKIFIDFDGVWEKISSAYTGPFKEMLYGDSVLPSEDEVREAILAIGRALNEHEE